MNIIKLIVVIKMHTVAAEATWDFFNSHAEEVNLVTLKERRTRLL